MSVMINAEIKTKDFTQIFDETNRDWFSEDPRDNPSYNRVYLDSQLTYLTHLLMAKGHLFLNEVYDALSFARIPDGQLVGWLSSNNHDLGLFTIGLKDDGSYLLSFHVDGVIYNKI